MLKHEYLRKSMVDRIEKKNAINQYNLAHRKSMKEFLHKPNKTTQLRSLSNQHIYMNNDSIKHSAKLVGGSANQILRKQNLDKL